MEFEKLVKDASSVKMTDVTPNVEKLPNPDEQVKQESGFKFDEFNPSAPNPEPLSGMPPIGSPPPSKPKVTSVAGVKAVGRLFEKVLDEVCYYKHGLRLEDIGANINDKDLNLASELTGEAMDNGELPKMPPWLTLVILVALIFAYPTYKVFAFKMPKQASPVPPMTAGIDFSQPDVDINPRTKKPYVRGKYNRKKK